MKTSSKNFKNFVNHEHHYNMISNFRNRESTQINMWKDTRKKEISDMLKTSHATQQVFRSTLNGFEQQRNNKVYPSVTE